MADLLGVGWAFPVGVDARGRIALVRHKFDIEEAIRIILETPKGQRVMRPEFGSNLHDLIFAPNNATTAGLAAYYVEEALGMWEPRITLLEVDAHAGRGRSRPFAHRDFLRDQGDLRPPNARLPVLSHPGRNPTQRGRIRIAPMPLPTPKLDQRQFQSIVDEAKLLIPQYCPEWTDHNVSDPGVTLIELFAWMTDMLLYRVNQVPDKVYLTLLNLIGVQLGQPRAARAAVTFYLSLSATHLGEITIPADTEVATVRTETSEAIVFTTEEDLTIRPAEIAGTFSGGARPAGRGRRSISSACSPAIACRSSRRRWRRAILSTSRSRPTIAITSSPSS